MATLIRIPEALKPRSTPDDLKCRLDWGEPALTIVDLRDRPDFQCQHVQGAVSIPLMALVDTATANLERERDIYVYADSDKVAAAGADLLEQAGYTKVALLLGGLDAWKAAGYPAEVG